MSVLAGCTRRRTRQTCFRGRLSGHSTNVWRAAFLCVGGWRRCGGHGWKLTQPFVVHWRTTMSAPSVSAPVSIRPPSLREVLVCTGLLAVLVAGVYGSYVSSGGFHSD